MDKQGKTVRPSKVYVLDEHAAERIVRLANQLAEAVDVIIFNREKVVNVTDQFEQRLCHQLNRDLSWAKLDEIF